MNHISTASYGKQCNRQYSFLLFSGKFPGSHTCIYTCLHAREFPVTFFCTPYMENRCNRYNNPALFQNNNSSLFYIPTYFFWTVPYPLTGILYRFFQMQGMHRKRLRMALIQTVYYYGYSIFFACLCRNSFHKAVFPASISFPVILIFFCKLLLKGRILVCSGSVFYKVIPEIYLIPVAAVPYMNMICLHFEPSFGISFGKHHVGRRVIKPLNVMIIDAFQLFYYFFIICFFRYLDKNINSRFAYQNGNSCPSSSGVMSSGSFCAILQVFYMYKVADPHYQFVNEKFRIINQQCHFLPVHKK